MSLITRRKGLILAAPAIIGLRPKLARAQMGLPAGLGDEFTPVSGGAPIPPSWAVAAGFSRLAWSDDWTTNTVAPASGTTSGYNWYWATYSGGTSSNWNVQTTSTAAIAGAANGAAAPPSPSWNSGNPSPIGGIFSMNTGDFPNANVFSVPNNSTVLPANGDGVFQNFGVEFYVQCLALGPSTTPSQGWPALWSWSFENGSTIGQGNGPPITFGSSSGLTPTEIDFFETYGNIYGVYPDLDYGMAIHYPAGEAGVYSGNFPNAWDNNWHAVGCLVTSTHVTAYLDNAAVGGSPCVISSACPDLSSCHQFLILGTGNNWRVNLDYVRVWMA